MPNCLVEMMSALWILLTMKWRLPENEQASDAEESLQRLICNLDKRGLALQEQEHALLEEVQANKVRNRARCRQKFFEYKRVQVQKERLNTYRDMVTAHIDALNNTELNKALITTLQESAKTLKSMGAIDGVKQAELVVADVESSMAQVQELTQVLGQPINVNYSMDDWNEELEEFLRDDEGEGMAAAAAIDPPSVTRNRAPMTPRSSMMALNA